MNKGSMSSFIQRLLDRTVYSSDQPMKKDIAERTSAELLRDIIWAHKGQFFHVTFRKKDGSMREMLAQVGYKEGYDGENTVSDKEEYVTVVERGEGDKPGKPKFRNVNSQNITRLAIGGKVIYTKD